MFKNNKGVTLLSLVVAVIILLILAGITIQMATSNNSVVNKSKRIVIISNLKALNTGLEEYLLHKEEEVGYDSLKKETSIIHEMTINDGKNTKIGVFKDLEKLGITGKYGLKGAYETRTQINDPKVDLDDVFYIDFTDNNLYYIKDGKSWRLEEKIKTSDP